MLPGSLRVVPEAGDRKLRSVPMDGEGIGMKPGRFRRIVFYRPRPISPNRINGGGSVAIRAKGDHVNSRSLRYRDRFAGLALQPTEQATDDQRGVLPLLDAVELGQVELEKGD
jgi:hypothetical protein